MFVSTCNNSIKICKYLHLQKMISDLETAILNLNHYLQDRDKWESLLIDRYPPTIHRLSLKIGDNRTLLLHKLFNCQGQKAFMHSHSWSLACKVVEGGYEMGVGFSNDRNIVPQATFTSIVKPGDVYEITNSNTWHYTKCAPETSHSYSIMIIGPRERERKALNNSRLTESQRNEVFDYFDNYNLIK